jgi:hypothetical protein
MKNILLFAVLFIIGLFNAFSQDADSINRAISEGDLKTLYTFISNPAGQDQRLLTNANQAITRYTTNDSATVRYRTNRMDSRVRNVGNALMENVFQDPERYLPDVVARLISGVNDQFQRAKVINDWICDNIAYDVETAFFRTNRRQDYISVLRIKKAVCAGYTNLFNQMCRLASIESIGISGYSKGFGYAGRIGSQPDHDWNAVKINNKWYLIDVTWNAGHVDQRTFIKNYSTDYLFLESRAFLYSHLPVENRYQFYAPIITHEQFMDEPYISGVFFRYQLGLKNEFPRYNNFVNEGGFIIELICSNNNVQLSSALRTIQQQDIDGATWQGKSGNTFSFIYDVPDNQSYSGQIFARLNNERLIQEEISINLYEQRIIPLVEGLLQNRKITEKERELFVNSYFKVQENGYYYFIEDQFDTARNNAVIKIHPLVDLSLEMLEPVLDFNLRASAGYTGFRNNYVRRFPDTYTAFDGVSNTNLISPINGLLKSGSTETFIIESRDFTRFAIIIDEEFIFFERINNNSPFKLVFEIPSDITELEIFGSRNNRNYDGLLRYFVE